MTWLIRVGDQEISTDDFTLNDLEQLEKEAELPWSQANPAYSSVKAMRANLRVAFRLAGRDPARVDRLTLGQVKMRFRYVKDEPFDPAIDAAAEEAEEDDPGPLDPSSPGSSPGASTASGGPRRKRAASA